MNVSLRLACVLLLFVLHGCEKASQSTQSASVPAADDSPPASTAGSGSSKVDGVPVWEELTLPLPAFVSEDAWEREVEAWEAIEAHGGKYVLKYEPTYTCPNCEHVSRRPDDQPIFSYDCPQCERAVQMKPHAQLIEIPTEGNFTDADLTWLAAFSELETLEIYAHDVTDRLVPILANLKSLKRLVIKSTKISPEGDHKLREELPNCFIRH